MSTLRTISFTAAFLLCAVGCSSHWYQSTVLPEESVTLTVESLTRELSIVLSSDDELDLPCDQLEYHVDMTWDGDAGDIDVTSDELTLTMPLEESGQAQVVGFQEFEFAEDDATVCVGTAEFTISTSQALSGLMTLEVHATDASSGPGDEPEGETTLVATIQG